MRVSEPRRILFYVSKVSTRVHGPTVPGYGPDPPLVPVYDVRWLLVSTGDTGPFPEFSPGPSDPRPRPPTRKHHPHPPSCPPRFRTPPFVTDTSPVILADTERPYRSRQDPTPSRSRSRPLRSDRNPTATPIGPSLSASLWGARRTSSGSGPRGEDLSSPSGGPPCGSVVTGEGKGPDSLWFRGRVGLFVSGGFGRGVPSQVRGVQEDAV